jgi:serine/threonine protein kinase
LGTGNFSSVFQCKHKASGLIYAIKITKNSIKTVKSSGQILNEAQLLAFFASSGNHPNIVKYYNSWIEEKELFIQALKFI